MRISHLSDLHFGRHDDALAGGLAAEIASQSPDLVVVSGDFTQHGTTEEFQLARAFLDALPAPFLAVPGNHDIPAINFIRRFLAPYGLYRDHIAQQLEPFLSTEGVAIAGINTARRMRLEFNWSHGSISRGQLRSLERRFEAADPDAIRVVVAHHPLLEPEATVSVPMRRVDRVDLALRTFSRLGVRLVLSGHFHLSYVRRHEHAGELAPGTFTGTREAAAAPILVTQASSTISTRLRGEPNAYNLIDIADGVITVTVREWDASGAWITREKASAAA